MRLKPTSSFVRSFADVGECKVKKTYFNVAKKLVACDDISFTYDVLNACLPLDAYIQRHV